MTNNRGKDTIANGKNHALQVPLHMQGRIDNRVKIPDGTAAVSAEIGLFGIMPVTGKLGRLSSVADGFPVLCASQKTCLEIVPFHGVWMRGEILCCGKTAVTAETLSRLYISVQERYTSAGVFRKIFEGGSSK